MTRFNTSFVQQTMKAPGPPGIWVKTKLEGAGAYSLSIMHKSALPEKNAPKEPSGCAYARLSLMESGAVMASFPVMGMLSGTIRSLLGAAWFELATPLKLPDFVFGKEIEIPAGKHPIVFVLESWVVLFRPSTPFGYNQPG